MDDDTIYPEDDYFLPLNPRFDLEKFVKQPDTTSNLFFFIYLSLRASFSFLLRSRATYRFTYASSSRDNIIDYIEEQTGRVKNLEAF